MSKIFRLFKKYISLLIFFVAIKNAVSFIGNPLISTIGPSIGPWIQHLIIVVLSSIIIFFTKIKKKIKILMAILLIFLLSSIAINQYKTRGLVTLTPRDLLIKNYPDWDLKDTKKTPISNLSHKTVKEVYKMHEANLIEYDIDFLKKRYIDLKDLSNEEFFKYDKIFFSNRSVMILINTTTSSFETFWEEVLPNIDRDNELEFNGMTKNSKLLFICDGGVKAQIIAYRFFLEGYDSYYSSVIDYVASY
ncbi:hypothetical protein HN789_07705 [archaeon]|jgi:hypothetical protein|nr:hypothetical protein [archaeon]MBT4022848.1 hypothetical protein [archaeon]MBT4272958.1 hypothetical protein [archaeon]MBT4460951.1 hypothetical protein [archaeon]MBT4858022.1 hypothetical protein [archaeon]